MLRQVETRALVFFTYPKPNDLIHNEEDNQRSDDGERPGHSYAYSLIDYLALVALQQSGCLTRSEDGIDGAAGKDTGQQRPNVSSGAVHAESIERVVITKDCLHLDHHEVAENAGDQANPQCGYGSHEAGGGGDGD